MNSNCCRFPARTLACALLVAFGLTSALAQPVEWSGGALATSNAMGQATNWVGGVAPTAGANLRIATGNFTPATNSTDTISLNADRTVGSITFDNSATQFPSQLRLNANAGNGTTTRTLTINRDASNVVFDVVNGANVLISGNSSTLTSSFSGMNLVLAYSGMGIINVDGTSSLSIGGNAATLRGNGSTTAGIQKTGAGSLTIGGASANYTGGFQLSGGTLWVSATANSTVSGPFGTGALTIDGGTKLASTLTSTTTTFRSFDNPVHFTGGTITLGDTTNNNGITFTQGLFNNSGATASTVSGATILNVLSTVTINRSLSGSGSLTKDGAGTLNLNQQASYTGGTTLRGGQLQLGADYFPTNGDVTFDGGTLRVGNTGFTANGHATTLTSNGGTFSIAGNQTVNWNGDVSGVGALTMTGGGVLSLGGTNTYSGGTTVSQGTLRGSAGTGALSITSGAAYELNGANRTVGALSGGGNVTLGSSTLTTNSSVSGSFDGIISGTGGFTKAGTGALTLSGANTYSGATTVSGGTLTGVIGGGDLAVSSGASYDLGGANRSIAGLSGAGSVALGSSTLTTNSTANTTFSGVASGTGGLTKDGTGTLTLTGTNTYTGATAVNAGGLVANGSLASAVTLAAGTTLSGTGTFLNSVSIGGAHNPGNSPGIQTFNDLTYVSGAAVTWELAGNTVTQAANPRAAYDQVLVNGTLNFSGATTLSLAFNGAGSTVNWTDPFWYQARSWEIFDANTTLNSGNLTLALSDWTDGAGNQFSSVLGVGGAGFNLSMAGGSMMLNYTAGAIPEPSTYAMMLMGVGLLAFGAWRRRRQA